MFKCVVKEYADTIKKLIKRRWSKWARKIKS
jgi:hypothetical protein